MTTNVDLTEVIENFKKKFNKSGKYGRKKLIAISVILSVIYLFIGFYFGLVSLNFANRGFRIYLIIFLLIWAIPSLANVGEEKVVSNEEYKSGKDGVKKPSKKEGFKRYIKNLWNIPLNLAIVFTAVTILVSLFTSALFMSNDYRELLYVEDNQTFTESVEDYTTMQIPIVDRAFAEKLGDKKLGEDNLGSQFNVGSYYMICHNSNLYWIAPIEYNGFFPWTNQHTSPGYIMINANDQSDVKIIKDELNYVESAYLWDDLNRQNYFSHMTAWRANDAHLELTDEGKPMFVDTVYTNRIGYTNGKDVVGIIVTDPKTGDSKFYKTEDAPTWINHVITEDVIVEQLGFWGRYVNGFFNSVFAKKDVLEVSTGINYVYSNGDMYLQTGMTSVGSDESIVGVMMVNMRTKDAKFCRIGGATEWAAAQSAMGKVQEKNYVATDPIMINCAGVPTYFTMLKDNEGLVKSYAYVNVYDYRLVAVENTLAQAMEEYKKLIKTTEDKPAETYVVADIKQVIVGGDTHFYIKLTPNAGSEADFADRVFDVALSLNPQVAFVKVGDSISIKYYPFNSLYEISELTVVHP